MYNGVSQDRSGFDSTEYKMLWYKAWMVEKKSPKTQKEYYKTLVSNPCNVPYHLLDQREKRNIKWNTLETSYWIFRHNFDI